MTLAFLIYTWFPFGGQQRDFLRVVQECVKRGHRVVVYTLGWQGARPESVEMVIVPVRGFTSHKRYQRFTRWVEDRLQSRSTGVDRALDGVVGFNKMPGLDVYFAADPCYAEKAEKERGWYYRFTPRYRHFADYEKAVFAEPSPTQVLILSPQQRRDFSRHYPGCRHRLHDLPPGISPDRRPPADADEAADLRRGFRREFELKGGDLAVLQIGSGFTVKGLDRSIRAIAALPAEIRRRTQYLVIGQDKPGRFQRLACRLGVADNCRFLGGRDDVTRALLGADLLLHPAYSESAGYVLLEATIAGLPVLTTATCGYAWHIEAAGSGQVSASPFSQNDLNRRLLEMLTSSERETWRRNGRAYGANADLYSMPETAVDLIERFVESNPQPDSEPSTHAVP